MSVVPRGTCPEPELLTSLVDGELDHDTRDTVLAHLAGCEDCRAAVDAERRAKAALSTLSAPAPSPELTARLVALATESTEPVVVEPALLAPPRRSTHPGRRRLPAYLAAAASVLVFMVGGFAFLGASGQRDTPVTNSGNTAVVVPAADRLQVEHAATTSQAGLGGPEVATVSTSLRLPPAGAATGAP